jgi:hypothetical protein
MHAQLRYLRNRAELKDTKQKNVQIWSSPLVHSATLTDSFDAHAVAYISILSASIGTLAAFIAKQAASV